MQSNEISPVVVHIPYLINLCSPEDGLWKKSLDAYIEDIRRADMLGADYFVTHLGSPKGNGVEYGAARFSKGMNEAIARARPKLTSFSRIRRVQATALARNSSIFRL